MSSVGHVGPVATFEFDTHEVEVWGQWISVDHHPAVHLPRPYRTALWHPQGVLVDNVLFAFEELLRVVKDEEAEEAEAAAADERPAYMEEA